MNAPAIISLTEAERIAARPRPSAPEMRATFAEDLDGLPIPSRRWLVDGWIPDRAVTLLGGDGGVGKSLLTLQLMAGVALGRDWLGIPVEQRKAFAMFCEDDETEVHIRCKAVLEGFGASFAEAGGIAWAARSGLENVLMSFPSSGNEPGKPTRIYNELRGRVLSFGARLVIVDTVADTFGGNENFRSQVRGFVGMLRNLANEIDGAVVLTAHPSVAGQQTGTGLSGSTAWNNSVRSRLYLTRPPARDGEGDPDARVLKRMKSNYAGIGDEIKMTWRNGILVPESVPGALDRMAANAKADREFLDYLGRLTAQGEAVTSHTSPSYAPTIMSKRFAEEGARKGELEKAMGRLLNSGKVRVEEDGPKSKRRRRLVLAGGCE
jgi:RecA-family ATPase